METNRKPIGFRRALLRETNDNKVLLAGLIRPDHKAGCFWGGVGWAAIIIGSLGNLTQLGRNFLCVPWSASTKWNCRLEEAHRGTREAEGTFQGSKMRCSMMPRTSQTGHVPLHRQRWLHPRTWWLRMRSQHSFHQRSHQQWSQRRRGPESDSKVRKTILPPRQEAVVYIVDFRGHISYGDASQEILWLPLVGNSRLSFPSQTSQVKLRMASTASAVLQGGQEKSTKWGPGPDVRGEMELFEAGNFWGWMPQKPPGWRYYHLWQTGDPKLTPILHQWYRHWFFWWDWL